MTNDGQIANNYSIVRVREALSIRAGVLSFPINARPINGPGVQSFNAFYEFVLRLSVS